MNYNELTRLHFEVAAQAGVLPAAVSGAAGHGCRGSAGSRESGTWVQFDVRIIVINHIDTVELVRFLAFGCPHVIAVCDWLAEFSIGLAASREMAENLAVLQTRFALPVEKLGRLLVIEDAWSAAMTPHILEGVGD